MNITIIGLGLIGGSIAIDIKNLGIGKITAYDSKLSALKYALEHNLIDNYEKTIEAAIKNADIIIIAVPVLNFADVLKEIKVHLKPKLVITDVCSVKGQIVTTAKKILKKNISQFVPGHPISGSEKSGVQHYKTNLFTGQYAILTPPANTDAKAIKKITALWKKLGAKVAIMDAKQHDEILAATSHLPHVISYAYMNIFSSRKEIVKYSGGSFSDISRIAHSNPKFWLDIFKSNKKALAKEINRFKKQLEQLLCQIQY
jgi:prephenate dehydrogenase